MIARHVSWSLAMGWFHMVLAQYLVPIPAGVPQAYLATPLRWPFIFLSWIYLHYLQLKQLNITGECWNTGGLTSLYARKQLSELEAHRGLCQVLEFRGAETCLGGASAMDIDGSSNRRQRLFPARLVIFCSCRFIYIYTIYISIIIIIYYYYFIIIIIYYYYYLLLLLLFIIIIIIYYYYYLLLLLLLFIIII